MMTSEMGFQQSTTIVTENWRGIKALGDLQNTAMRFMEDGIKLGRASFIIMPLISCQSGNATNSNSNTNITDAMVVKL